MVTAGSSSSHSKPSQALLLSLHCSLWLSSIRYLLAWMPLESFSLRPRRASSMALFFCARPLNAADWDILCSLGKQQLCRRSGFVKQTPSFFSFFPPFWGFLFYSILPPHPTLFLGLFQEQPLCHSLPPKAQRASFSSPLAVQDTKKLN